MTTVAGARARARRGAKAARIQPYTRRAALAVVVLAVAALDAHAATRSVTLRGDAPWFDDATLLWANVGLVLVVLLQALRGWRARRAKYRLVRPAGEPAPSGEGEVAAEADRPGAGVVRCGRCAQPLRVAAAERPLRFRCPTCAAGGVVP